MSQLGIITGLASEADCLDGIVDPAYCHVRCAGADSARANRLARDLVQQQGCSALLSFGVAGGLAPTLRAGDVVLAEKIVADGQVLRSEPSWLNRLKDTLTDDMPVTTGVLAGVAVAVASAGEKRRLHDETGGMALDMESHAVASAAQDLGVPFLAVRVIADGAGQSIPLWLPGVIDQAGKVKLSTFLGGFARHPGDGIEVFRLAEANRRAMRSLRRVALLLGPGGFGLL